ncbi:Six-hairpin glycosidase-like protein [Fennellomyces sp. T-0311]|nr:Six-hairpin glycosidase-like protein [Fennellomyces sp. T-0311]
MHLYVLIWMCLSAFAAAATDHSSCNSPIYCDGPLLRTVQLARLFPDSKTFVDMPTKKPIDEVLKAFESIGGQNASHEAIASFVVNNFDKPGSEIVQHTVEKNATPSWVESINDDMYRSWIEMLDKAWGKLTYKFDMSKLCPGCVSSALPVNRLFVVPGGRFREFYYWDTYFVIRGLLLSDLDDLAKDMIENLLDFVDTYGFVPNGARIYYLNRSQPPLLTEMVKIYYEKTGDKSFLRKALPTLDKEYKFWLHNTTVHLDEHHSLNRYNVQTGSPRPESYVEDYDTAKVAELNSTEITDLYSNLATGAETGWDYSSRWTKIKQIEDNDPLSILRALNTRNIIPVDLNAMLWSMEHTLAQWHTAPRRVLYYKRQARRRLVAMDKYLWNEEHSAFYDYDLSSRAQNIEFTPAGMAPFWLGAVPDRAKKVLPRVFDQVVQALERDPGILTTSTYNTTLQWDWPNGWPPLQYIAMRAMLNVNTWLGGNTEIESLARTLAERNAASAFCAWYKTGGSIPGLLDKITTNADDNGHMFEKFDVRHLDAAGSGGEYEVQVGFGWTNGVTMWIFNTFAGLTAPDCTSTFGYPVEY